MTKVPGNILTVVIRNDSPLIFSGDKPSYRSVQIVLTEYQLNQLSLEKIGKTGGVDLYEDISHCFIEPK
jgi:hypothetical protein